MNGILNDRTGTVHREATEEHRRDAECGALRDVGSHALEEVSVDRAVREAEAERCGRCFDGGRGY